MEKKRTSRLDAVVLLIVLAFSAYQYYENNRLVKEYNGLVERYNTLYNDYTRVKAVGLLPPYSSISGGKIRWVFYDLKNNLINWEMPFDSYRSYVSVTKPIEVLSLSAMRGTISTYDLRPYIQPSFFRLVIDSLTKGRSDREFVREADNIKNQIVVYGEGLGQAPYQFSAETLTEGRGRCADTTILLASMLIEGNRGASYNFKVYVYYVQLVGTSLVSDNWSLTQANHAIVQVEFSNGEIWSIETTTNYFSSYSQAFTGWKFEVTAIVR